MNRIHVIRLALLGATAISLVACINPTVYVKADRPQGGTSSGSPIDGPEYVVVPGDTLFSIAFRNQLELSDLVAWNQIENPSLIRVGQRLRLSSNQPVFNAPDSNLAPGNGSEPVVGVIADAAPVFEDAPAATVELSPVTQVGSGSVVSEALPDEATMVMPGDEPVVAVAASAAAAATPGRSGPAPSAVSAAGLSWPARGRVISNFIAGDPTRSGIDIAGSEGDPVFAAGDGTVVYSGVGIIGYGELIVVRHANGLLTAYGNNKGRQVAEGGSVKRGQQIATMGRDQKGREILAFEVRRQGKPINPTTQLPAAP